uniref:Uncharacterized protein n=1 Tax=viral metagenome TaxID=1070528 RepID=A0A6C0CQI4_9ZZZZ
MAVRPQLTRTEAYLPPLIESITSSEKISDSLTKNTQFLSSWIQTVYVHLKTYYDYTETHFLNIIGMIGICVVLSYLKYRYETHRKI